MVPLGDVATIERSGVDPTVLDRDTPYLGLEHIESGGPIREYSSIGRAELTSTKFRFDERQVLFGKLRPNLGKIARPDRAGVCSTDILPITPSTRLDRGYLAHYLSQPSMVAFAASRTSGANLPRLSPGVLATFEVPLPEMEEQRRIAAILDKADAIRAKRRQVLAHLDALTQSIFHDMFGDGAGEVLPLGVVVTRIDSGTSPVCEPRPAMAAEWGVLKLSAVTRGVFNAEENKAFLGEVGPMKANEVRSGDVLMTRKNTRELVGAVALVENVRPRLLLPDLVFRLRLDQEKVDARYFQTLLMTPSVRVAVQRLSGGSAGSMPNISKERLRALPLPIPPLERQRGFAARFRVIAEQRTAISAELSKLNALFAALQSRAFNGEL